MSSQGHNMPRYNLETVACTMLNLNHLKNKASITLPKIASTPAYSSFVLLLRYFLMTIVYTSSSIIPNII